MKYVLKLFFGLLRLIDLGLAFRSLIHLQLIFVYSVR